MISNKLAVAAVMLMVSTVARVADASSGPDNPCSVEQSDPAKTFLDCFVRLYNEGPEKAAAARVEGAVAKAANSSEQTDAAVSVKDFLPGLVTALGLGELSEDDSSQTLANNWTWGDRWALSSKLVRQNGGLFEPLKTALAAELDASVLDDRVAALEKEIGDFDDTRLETSLSYEGKIGSWQFGRQLREYDAIVNDYYEAITADFPAGGMADNIQRASVQAASLGLPPETPVAAAFADKQSAENALRVARTMETLAAQLTASVGILEKTLQQGNYYDLAELIENQPQLYATGFYRYRDGVVGPDRWELSAHFEYGFRSLNAARNECGWGLAKVTPAEASAEAKERRTTCLSNFLLTRAGKEAQSPNRFTASLAYSHTDDFDFPLPGDHFAFHVDPAQSWIINTVYGRSLRVDEDGADVLRLAIEANYEDVTGDPLKQSRLVATATVTQRLAEKLYASISAVWADKPEYRGDVDEELSARAGIKWKLSREKQDA